MKLEASQKKLEAIQRKLDNSTGTDVTPNDLNITQMKVAKAQQNLTNSLRKLETFNSSRGITFNSSSQDKVDAIESADDKEFQEFVEMVSTPQKPE